MQLRMMVALVLPLMQHLLLLLVMMCCNPTTSTTVTGAEVPYYEDKDCPSTVNGTYAPNSTYHSNLAALAAELIRNSTAYGSAAGSAGAAPDVVYGVALCRGDSRGSYCAEHLGEVFDAVMNRSDTPRCVFHRNATVYYDRVQVRFADADFLSGYGNEPEGAWNNTNLVDAAVAGPFTDHVAELMGAVAAAAASQPDRYGTGVSWFEADGGGKPVYGLAQCTRDMSPERCGGCLRRVVSEIPVKMNSRQKGGRILGVRCIIRYEMDDKFFEMDNETLFLHMPKSNRKSKAWLWVIVVLVSTVACVFACFVLPRELKKRRQRERARLELRRLSMAVQNVVTLWRLEEGNSGFSLYDFSQIRAATDDFASGNKLGQGPIA